MAENTEDKKPTPPYLPYKTLTNFLERLKVGIPARIDRSVMGSFSGAAQAALFTALKYLHLIDQNHIPTEALTRLVNAQGEEREKFLKVMVGTYYPFLFKGEADDFKRMTAHQLQERFEASGVSGGTVPKSIAFFMAMAKDAGIELSPHLKKFKGAGRSTVRTRRLRPDRGDENNEPLHDEVREPRTEILTWQQILASKFPAFDPSWSAEVQAKWFDGFKELMGQFKRQSGEEEEK